MIELFLLVLLVAIVALSIRNGKPGAPDDPIIIEKPGRCHLTLAPQLNHTQTFLERIADQFALAIPPQGDLPTLYLEVRDPQAPVAGASLYLLATAWRSGQLYFQAILPSTLRQDSAGRLEAIRDFSVAVLALHPFGGRADMAGTENLRIVIDSVAHQSGMSVKGLGEDG